MYIHIHITISLSLSLSIYIYIYIYVMYVFVCLHKTEAESAAENCWEARVQGCPPVPAKANNKQYL